MAVIQLTGGSVQAPAGALTIKLSQATAVELVLIGADGSVVPPNYRVTPSEVVIVPGDVVTVTARALGGGPLPAGSRLGVTVKAASGAGDEVVRPASDVGGRQAVSLVQIGDGQVIDLVGQSAAADHGWMQRGSHAYHVNHQSVPGRRTPWAAVLDGSATAHHTREPDAYRDFLELVLGIAASAHGGAPEQWLVATRPPTDITSSLASDDIDWDLALAHEPAPWPSLQEAVATALDKLPADGALLLITDGVFVDYREVQQLVEGRDCVVVAFGRSKFGARMEDRVVQFWEEELAALDGFERVASVASLAGLADAAPALADAMFPGSKS